MVAGEADSESLLAASAPASHAPAHRPAHRGHGVQSEAEEEHDDLVRLRKLRRSSWRGARGKVLEEKINSCPVGKSQRMSILALFLLMIPYGMEIDMSAVINSETPASWALRGDVYILWLFPYAGLIAGALCAVFCGDRWGRRSVLYAHSAVYSTAVLVAASADSAQIFLAARFAMCASLGTAFPCAVALIHEIIPSYQRGKAVLLISALATAIGSTLVLCWGYVANLVPAVALSTVDGLYVVETSQIYWWRWLLLSTLVAHVGGTVLLCVCCLESCVRVGVCVCVHVCMLFVPGTGRAVPVLRRVAVFSVLHRPAARGSSNGRAAPDRGGELVRRHRRGRALDRQGGPRRR